MEQHAPDSRPREKLGPPGLAASGHHEQVDLARMRPFGLVEISLCRGRAHRLQPAGPRCIYYSQPLREVRARSA